MGTTDVPSVTFDYGNPVPATFTFPADRIVPSKCIERVKFTCTNSNNMCGLDVSTQDGLSSKGTFDSTVGSYTFVSNDVARFPVGTYDFTIDASINGKSASRSF